MAGPLAGRRCLVVDDEFLIALDIQTLLEQAGAAEVVCAGNAADALAALRAGRVDVAVLDLWLSRSGGNSLPIAQALTETGTPFVFLTGMRADSEQTRAFPAAPVIEKPYDSPSLLDALHRALGGADR